MFNISDVFDGTGEKLLEGGTYQVPLDLNQDGNLEDGIDKVLNFKSAGPLHTDAVANADTINHWYGTQKGDSVPVSGSLAQVAAAEAAQRKAAEAKAKASAVCAGRSEPSPTTQFVGAEPNRYGEYYGRMFFRGPVQIRFLRG